MNEFGLTSTALRSRRFSDKDIADFAAAGFTAIALAAIAGHVDLSDGSRLDALARAADAEGVSDSLAVAFRSKAWRPLCQSPSTEAGR